MTELLYLHDCYLREFDAQVTERGTGFVVLDRTAFYPEGGGQPSDTGTLSGVRVLNVKKEGNKVKHFLESEVPDQVHGVIDWDKRYKIMRMHSAQHLLSAIFLDDYGSETAGNQIHPDHSRIDFAIDKITPEMIEQATKKFNGLVDEGKTINLEWTDRAGLLERVDSRRAKLFERLPASVKNVRLVVIEALDVCPCAGTHVKNTNEIGHLVVGRVFSKGAGKTRMELELQ